MRAFRPELLRPPRDFVRPQLPHDRPICLEIGAGVGLHALSFAAQHPTIELYAIERTAEKFQKFWHSYQANPLRNLHPIHADAIPWVVHALPPESLERVFILYPNPEPKNPAQRWLNMPFFAFLLSRLKPRGHVHLASNIPEYLAEAKQQAEQTWQLPYEEKTLSEPGRTHFEIKYLQRGEPCRELVFTKPIIGS
ncbi:hypothetical protein [Thiolinea disciformis]|uniref:hypothetical protein n=1 Tax=Thiolinea disciformis TaxID=125614 RepID=UPI000373F9DF|nr:hypothetical protein [Thiolinea disciformis]